MNSIFKLLIFIGNYLLEICLEYLLEYQRFPQAVGILSDISANCLKLKRFHPHSAKASVVSTCGPSIQ